jgi:uncharacterized protein
VSKFGPLEKFADVQDIISMSVDEYETIRLIDLENLKQEECAERMNIARTTVQSIYDTARKKISDCLVNGKIIVIEGGEYILCNGEGGFCGKKGCGRQGRGFCCNPNEKN